jgi:hypothetical protein
MKSVSVSRGCAMSVGNLIAKSGHAADRARRRDERDVALAYPGDVLHPDVCGEAGQAERAEVGGGGELRGVDHAVLCRGPGRPGPPAVAVHDARADRDRRVAGRHDPAHRVAVHDLAQLVRRGVGLGVAHAPAHVQVEGEELVADNHLARGELGHRLGDDLEAVRRRDALRPPGEAHGQARTWLRHQPTVTAWGRAVSSPHDPSGD